MLLRPFCYSPALALFLDCWAALAGTPSLIKPAQPNKYIAANGRRAALLGYEDGTVEAWIFPIKLFRGLRLSVFVHGALDAVPLAGFAETAEVQPGRVTLTHVHPAFTIQQTWTAAPEAPAAAILLDIQTTRPLRLRLSLTPEMQPMWPASFGGVSTSWDASSGVLTFTEGLRRFRPVFGSPAFRRISEQVGHQLPDRTIGLEFDVPHSSRIPIIAAASRADYDSALKDPAALLEAAAAHFDAFLARTTRVEFEGLTMAYDWARLAIERGWACNNGVGCGLVAGWAPSGSSQRPGFGWYFGGDTMISSWAMLDYGDFEGARSALEFLLARQRADGKIMHEWTQSAALLDWNSYPYGYYHADTTPLFLYSVSLYLRHTGDREFLSRHWPRIERAWRFTLTTMDDDALLSNLKGGAAAVETGALSGKVARDVYLQGVWLAGLAAFEQLARWSLHPDAAAQAAALLSRARPSIAGWFVPEKSLFAFAELKDGSRFEANSAWQAMLLAEGGLDPTLAARAAASLARPALATPWGARLFATDSPFYNPLGYNDGSVWPFVTAQAALALLRHGQPAPAYTFLDGMAQATGLAGAGFLPEYFSGDRFAPGPRAVPHQLFSSAALIHPLLSGLLGLQPDAMEGLLHLDPSLPCGIPPVTLERYRVGQSRLFAVFTPARPATRIEFRIEGAPLRVLPSANPCFDAAPRRTLSPGVAP